MSDPTVIAAVSAAAALAAAVITAIVGRRSATDALKVDVFEASLRGLQSVMEAQDKRIGDLERQLGAVQSALLTEQQEHASTHELLQLALRHIRDMLRWLGGDHTAEPPAVPEELSHQL